MCDRLLFFCSELNEMEVMDLQHWLLFLGDITKTPLKKKREWAVAGGQECQCLLSSEDYKNN